MPCAQLPDMTPAAGECADTSGKTRGLPVKELHLMQEP